MSTSHIPVYYDNHLVGSITLAEFMKQPRYDGLSVMSLMSLNKEQLRNLLRSLDERINKCSGMTKSHLLWCVMMDYWVKQGMIAWELDALHEIQDVYLAK
jgi:hypothetical protein